MTAGLAQARHIRAAQNTWDALAFECPQVLADDRTFYRAPGALVVGDTADSTSGAFHLTVIPRPQPENIVPSPEDLGSAIGRAVHLLHLGKGLEGARTFARVLGIRSSPLVPRSEPHRMAAAQFLLSNTGCSALAWALLSGEPLPPKHSERTVGWQTRRTRDQRMLSSLPHPTVAHSEGHLPTAYPRAVC